MTRCLRLAARGVVWVRELGPGHIPVCGLGHLFGLPGLYSGNSLSLAEHVDAGWRSDGALWRREATFQTPIRIIQSNL